ncbi:hypothetical protein [Kitasatospora sp. NPDC050543]|uniref:hypothetical protein n=1 Tax=Kitasatospora sp. NPDC050543 TaxID=3364054 RepID=UPI0037992495
MSSRIVRARWWIAAAASLALALGSFLASGSDKPTIPTDRAKQQIDAEFAAVSQLFDPTIEWTDLQYAVHPVLSGFCGTQGCERTGRAELAAKHWAKTPIADTRQADLREKVSSLWRGRGYVVRNEARLLEVKTAEHYLDFMIDQAG